MQANFNDRPEGLNAEKAFEDSFQGSLKVYDDAFGGQSCEYYNPVAGVNKIPQIKEAFIAKSSGSSIDTQTGGAGTAGTALVPVYVDNKIVDRTIRETPVRNILARRAVRGLTYDFVPLTAKGGAVWRAENASIADQIDTYDRVSVDIKFLYAKGRVSGPAIAAMRGFIDPSALDLSVKTASIMEAEEDAIINGDASSNPAEPNGLITTITTNTTNLSGTSPKLAQIRAEFATSYNSNGQINLAVTDATTHNYIKGLLLDLQRNVEKVDSSILGFGIVDAFMFDGVIFIRDKFMPTTGSAKRILFLDTRYVFMAVLQDLTYEEKASENDSSVYMLKEYVTPVVTFEAACTQMYGIL